MKTIFTFSLLSLSLFSEADYWTRKDDFPGLNRRGPFSFSIEGKGYIGCGFDSTYEKDFWEYDPSLNSWTQKVNYPGDTSAFGVGFSIINKGYAGLGNNNHFYEYDPSTNIWIAKATYPSVNF